jgi:hypothetical protein
VSKAQDNPHLSLLHSLARSVMCAISFSATSSNFPCRTHLMSVSNSFPSLKSLCFFPNTVQLGLEQSMSGPALSARRKATSEILLAAFFASSSHVEHRPCQNDCGLSTFLAPGCPPLFLTLLALTTDVTGTIAVITMSLTRLWLSQCLQRKRLWPVVTAGPAPESRQTAQSSCCPVTRL